MRKKNAVHFGNSGFSLAELMVCVLLSSIMYLTVFVSAQTGILSMRHTDVRIHLNDQLRRAVDAFGREIVQTSPAVVGTHISLTTDGNGNSVVSFQIPIDADGINDWSGSTRADVIDNTTEYVQWGAHKNLGNENSDNALLGQWIRYSVQQNANITDPSMKNQLVRDILLANGTTVDANQPSKIIASNITRFQVTKNTQRLDVVLEGTARDNTEGGGSTRIIRDSYSTELILRNDTY